MKPSVSLETLEQTESFKWFFQRIDMCLEMDTHTKTVFKDKYGRKIVFTPVSHSETLTISKLG